MVAPFLFCPPPFLPLIITSVFVITDMIEIVAKYKYQIGIATFILCVIFGGLLDIWTTNYIAERRIENYYDINETFASIIGWAGPILPPILLLWVVVKFIIVPCEKKAIQMQNEAYDIFIKSLETIKENNVNGINHLNGKCRACYKFNYDWYQVEVSQHGDENFITLFWYNKETKGLVNVRIIDFKDEPTIHDALKHGPLYKELK
jgi:hypothetical protein